MERENGVTKKKILINYKKSFHTYYNGENPKTLTIPNVRMWSNMNSHSWLVRI